eukprot:4098553-Pyramimonas_sp.AAC.1
MRIHTPSEHGESKSKHRARNRGAAQKVMFLLRYTTRNRAAHNQWNMPPFSKLVPTDWAKPL